MNPTEEYLAARDKQIELNKADRDLHIMSEKYMDEWHRTNYVKGFTWMGIPIMQLPQDLMAMQEIIWRVKPDYIIETGVAFGGMTVFYASMLEALGHGIVYGIDIDIRPNNEKALNDCRLRKRIKLVYASSSCALTAGRMLLHTSGGTVLVSLDSNHTHDHVLQELRLYSPLVSLGSYIVVFDTSIETLNPKYIGDRPWGRGNSPGSAVKQFLSETDEFVADTDIENKILLTSAPGGWLRRVK